MILNDIPESSGLIIVSRPFLDPDAFGHSDLDIVDPVSVPQGFKNRVGKPENQKILDSLFAEIMVNPVHLGFIEILVEEMIQLLG